MNRQTFSGGGVRRRPHCRRRVRIRVRRLDARVVGQEGLSAESATREERAPRLACWGRDARRASLPVIVRHIATTRQLTRTSANTARGELCPDECPDGVVDRVATRRFLARFFDWPYRENGPEPCDSGP